MILIHILCKDINECAKDELNNCHENADCKNLFGSYTCVCKEGYKGDGIKCEDYDECVNDDWNECHQKANCTNTIGSYHCACIEGYTGNGKDCKDINECDKLGESSKCQNKENNGKCINTPGNYNCGCQMGYEGDGLKDGKGCSSKSIKIWKKEKNT